MPTLRFKFGAKIVLCSQNAAGTTKHNENIDYEVVVGILAHDLIIKSFKLEHDYLAERKSLVVAASRTSRRLVTNKRK